jgi:hypothetical protein
VRKRTIESYPLFVIRQWDIVKHLLSLYNYAETNEKMAKRQRGESELKYTGADDVNVYL